MESSLENARLAVPLVLVAVGLAWQPFETWVHKWLDPEDKTAAGLGSLDLAGVLHQVSQPIEEPRGHWTTVIDFGSSSTDAFWELLVALADMGARRVSLSTQS